MKRQLTRLGTCLRATFVVVTGCYSPVGVRKTVSQTEDQFRELVKPEYKCAAGLLLTPLLLRLLGSPQWIQLLLLQV